MKNRNQPWSKVISTKIASCKELPQNYQFHSNSENQGYCNFSWSFLEILLYIRFFVSQKRYTKTKMFHKFKPLYRDATIQALIRKLDSPPLPFSMTKISCNLVFYVALYFRYYICICISDTISVFVTLRCCINVELGFVAPHGSLKVNFPFTS